MIFATDEFEKNAWSAGKEFVVGIDEVGRGCWAGPAVVGAVVFPKNTTLTFKLADSKLLSAKKREALAEKIKQHCSAHAVHTVPLEDINTMGVGQAIQKGFSHILSLLSIIPDFILIDAFKIKNYPPEKQQNIIKGDQQSISIAAASILAKVFRDTLMNEIHQTEPRFAFNTNKGYGTAEHRSAIAKFGLCTHHRSSFNLQKWENQNEE